MKHLTITFLLTISAYLTFAQKTSPCAGHPLFSNLPNFKVSECKSREFDKLEFTLTDKSKNSSAVLEKSGEYAEVSFQWSGEWEKRPAAIQIYQNYKNAIIKAGGELPDAYYKNSTFYGKLKKGGDMYWIQVYTDGSGHYSVKSIREAAMRQDVAVTADQIKKDITEDGKIALYGIYFNTAQATLKTESAPTLTEISKFLKDNPTLNVYIVGHTDNTGDFSKNLVLSKDRAAAVTTELTDKYGVNKNQMNAQGVGPLAPVAGNTTEAGKAKNRRVEMVIR